MQEVVRQLHAGDHVALIYRNRTEQFDCIVPYIQTGLARNERCLYIADDNSVPMILRRLANAGVAVNEAQDKNALRVVTKHETYMRHGIFEPARMIADLRDEVEVSLRLGFSALRASGEMTWALDLPSSLARLMEYESDLHARFPAGFLGLCQYDETRFPEHVISEMIRIHPRIIARGQLLDHAFYRSSNAARTGPEPAIKVDQLVAA